MGYMDLVVHKKAVKFNHSLIMNVLISIVNPEIINDPIITDVIP